MKLLKINFFAEWANQPERLETEYLTPGEKKSLFVLNLFGILILGIESGWADSCRGWHLQPARMESTIKKSKFRKVANCDCWQATNEVFRNESAAERLLVKRKCPAARNGLGKFRPARLLSAGGSDPLLLLEQPSEVGRQG